MIFPILHIGTSIIGLILLMTAAIGIWLSQEDIESNWILESGWLLYGVGIIVGAFWAYDEYGSYWVWDPKEIFSLITFTLFFIYIIVESILGKKEKKLAILICVIFLLFTMVSTRFLDSYHGP